MGEVRDALPSHAGQEPEGHRRPGQRSRPPQALRVSGPRSRPSSGGLGRAPPSQRPTHRGLRSPSDKPWPRRSLSRRVRCAASWVRMLMRQLLHSLGTGRGYGAARHVPGICNRSRHVRSVNLRRLPLAPRRRWFVPPLSQLAIGALSPKRIQPQPTSGLGIGGAIRGALGLGNGLAGSVGAANR